MGKFIHTSVRLNTDLGRATRFVSNPEQLAKWLCDRTETSADSTRLLLAGVNNPEDCWNWHFEEIRREKMVIITCGDLFDSHESHSFTLEIQLMKCTSRTEYCSEIHIIQRGFDDSEADDGLRSMYAELWKVKLEVLRTLVNGKWVIQDRDLTLDMFR